jgi:hypothetical protein
MSFDDDFNYRDGQEYDPRACDGVRLFNHIGNEIQYGRHLDEIDKLSDFDRQLYQDQDFFFVGTKVFKKVDPIDQALDGDWGRDIQDADKYVKEEWERRLASEIDPDYSDAMDYVVDQPLEEVCTYPHVTQETDYFKVISVDFTNLTGLYVALGYVPPKDKYKFIGNFAPNQNVIKAIAREDKCSSLLHQVEHASVLKDLNHIIVAIREDYNHDKEIRTKWSEQSRIKNRYLLETKMRESNADEEAIRKAMWADFNKMPGKFVSKGRYLRSFGSKWHRDRSRGYQELIMTYAQWQSVYKAIDMKKIFFLTDYSETLYRSLEKSINDSQSLIELQKAHEIISDKSDELNKIHRTQIWKIWGSKAKQKGLRGERFYG